MPRAGTPRGDGGLGGREIGGSRHREGPRSPREASEYLPAGGAGAREVRGEARAGGAPSDGEEFDRNESLRREQGAPSARTVAGASERAKGPFRLVKIVSMTLLMGFEWTEERGRKLLSVLLTLFCTRIGMDVLV